MAGFAYPSATNTFVPSTEATGGMIVGYSRDIKNWAINRYSKIVPVNKMVGLYINWASQNAARISSDGSANVWEDGTEAPIGTDNLEQFEYLSYRTHRRIYPFALGSLSINQADWPVFQAHSRMAAQQCMTERTNLGVSALVNASWPTGHSLIVDNAGGGGALFASGDNWATGTTQNPYIKIALNDAAVQINIDTLGIVTPNMLKLVINPNSARTMSQSYEIQDMLKQSMFALGQLTGGVQNQNSQWGLPPKLYEFEVEVDQTVASFSLKGATFTPQYVVPENAAFLVARDGELEGIEGAPSFSTLTGFFYNGPDGGGEMTVETKDDIDNKMRRARILSNYSYQVVAPQSGAYFTDIFGTSAPAD